jgi:hypothetical protein
MYAEVNAPHHEPHFHAYYQDEVATFSLEPNRADYGFATAQAAKIGRGVGGVASG